MDLGVEGVEIEDRIPISKEDLDAMYVDIAPPVLEDDGIAYLSFYLEEGTEKTELLENIYNELEEMRSYVNVGAGTIEESLTEDLDWINNWKKYFHQFTIDDILVIPSWEDVEVEHSDKMVIRIDPGTAFGTGMHETTQLCIRSIKKQMTGGERILDVGCGSGILGMLALKFGASYSVGTDLDPCAIEATYENMTTNHIEREQYEVLSGNVIDDEMIQEKVGAGCYDIVVANILTEVLISLTPVVHALLKPNGLYITSGIINCNGKEDIMKKTLQETGFEVVEVNYQGEWVSITAKKKEM
ncbi:MAG: 50S ribosomal protein L11 methyltransferase, partial [Eubacteriales bacterium]